MTDRIRAALATLTPAQASIVAVLFIGSVILAALAVWGFSAWNRRQLNHLTVTAPKTAEEWDDHISSHSMWG